MSLSSSRNKKLKSQYGDWALITGASSVLGLEFATLLAEAEFNLILTVRNKENLLNLSENLKAIHSIETQIIVGDLTESTTIENITFELKPLVVDVLVAST